ncbi:FEKKY domain-containing protein [Tenacibaculum retecalamus]|uniref:FEKKY domain-containing protein n=1 Tax=Tenacibaculum retecalamus TaxID=3018315 RepID=UPI0023D96ADE|nr:hypothetical protein [Tenacibaculum retecalamus]WBX70343.1 hypothetical protein PG912_08635 [Tenacibaculum retecalamus]
MKLKLGILIMFFLVSSINFGQNRELTDEEYNNSTAGKITFVNPETCEQVDKWIKADFNNQNVYLFLQNGIESVEYTTDKEFENTYGIYFFDFGCVQPSEKCVIEYNTRVFDYLTEEYGKKWKREIRDDVIGFKEWKRKNRRK